MDIEPEAPAEYAFTPPEEQIFRVATLEAQAKIDALNAMVRLVVGQQRLAGSWQLKHDGSGLIKTS